MRGRLGQLPNPTAWEANDDFAFASSEATPRAGDTHKLEEEGAAVKKKTKPKPARRTGKTDGSEVGGTPGAAGLARGWIPNTWVTRGWVL